MKKFHYIFSTIFLFFSILDVCYGADPWGVWVDNLPKRYLDVHYELAHWEMELSKAAKDSTNHALFQLSLYDKETHEYIKSFKKPTDPEDPEKLFSFPSGEYMFGINPYKPGSTLHELWKHRKEENRKEKETGVEASKADWPKYADFVKSTKGTKLVDAEVDDQKFNEQVERLCTSLHGLKDVFANIKEAEGRIRLVEEAEENWKRRVACKLYPIRVDGKVHDSTKSIYDSEQLIMAYVDYLMDLLRSSEHPDHKFLVENDKSYYFVVHLHTLQDMCPFCLYSLHMKIGEWNNFLNGTFGERLSLMAIVSSRVEYRSSDFSFLSRLYTSYRNNTLRSIGIQMQSLTEEGLLELAQQGFVIQMPLNPVRLYGPSSSSSSSDRGAASASSSR